MDFSVTADQRRHLLSVAREAITARLEHREAVYPAPPAGLDFACGAFVTLKTRDRRLRGCIGTMTGTMAVSDTIMDLACSSAFRDPRFPELKHEELANVTIEISLLSPLEVVSSAGEITVGTHGLLIRGRGRSGVLLPQVAVEERWDRETFLAHTCRKAGLGPDAWRDPEVAIHRFSAILFSETHK